MAKKMTPSELNKMFANKPNQTKGAKTQTPAPSMNKKKGKVFNKTGM